MGRKSWPLQLGLALTLFSAGAAEAQRSGDWYRDSRPYLGRRAEANAREARLWTQLERLRSAVSRADRRGDIRPREADRYMDRLTRVARFLRQDRRLTSDEFDRRRDDLDDIARDLHRAVVRRDDNRRYGDRYDGRYGRAQRDCDICGGPCRH